MVLSVTTPPEQSRRGHTGPGSRADRETEPSRTTWATLVPVRADRVTSARLVLTRPRSLILLVHFMNTSYVCFILEKQYIYIYPEHSVLKIANESFDNDLSSCFL